jgi:hypothetical protein
VFDVLKRVKGRRTLGPDMVVLEHDHRAQIVSMSVDPSHQHTVLLHQPETYTPQPSQNVDDINQLTRSFPKSSRSIED